MPRRADAKANKEREFDPDYFNPRNLRFESYFSRRDRGFARLRLLGDLKSADR